MPNHIFNSHGHGRTVPVQTMSRVPWCHSHDHDHKNTTWGEVTLLNTGWSRNDVDCEWLWSRVWFGLWSELWFISPDVHWPISDHHWWEVQCIQRVHIASWHVKGCHATERTPCILYWLTCRIKSRPLRASTRQHDLSMPLVYTLTNRLYQKANWCPCELIILIEKSMVYHLWKYRGLFVETLNPCPSNHISWISYDCHSHHQYYHTMS